ncbi:uncharacterized protein LOC115076168 [Rhinatrema bivittatum]|uniref:uncharacterized protein LOC115076168 n=1 Tax=Rhinatrema bivittatum TaxID=194408 RepID=UPI001128749E|nr:uncharacterized protein LOC115076168 [Rhinatrema bivittatum]
MQRAGFLLLSALWEGFLCQDQKAEFQVNIPKALSGEEGLCVIIWCYFSLSQSNKTYGLWFKEGVDLPIASSNSSGGQEPVVRSRFTFFGNISKQECTLRIDDVIKEDTGRYYFQIQNEFLQSFVSSSVGIDIGSTLTKPMITMPGILEANVLVTINCTSPGICAGTPPDISWTGTLITPSSSISLKSPHTYGTFTYISSFTFTPSISDHGKTLTCLVKYSATKTSAVRTVTLNVKGSYCHHMKTEYYLDIKPLVPENEGLCAFIQCHIYFPLTTILTKPHNGFWFREGRKEDDKPVVTTDKYRIVDEKTKDRFTFIGNIQECDCSFRINDAIQSDNGKYYFRFEGGEFISFKSHMVEVTIYDLWIPPVFSIPEMFLLDVPAELSCTAPGGCAGTPPTISWIGDLTTPNDTTFTESPFKDGTFRYSSSFTFTPSQNDHMKTINCWVYFPAVKKFTQRTLPIHVKSSPCHDLKTMDYLNVDTPVIGDVGMCVVIRCQFTIPLKVKIRRVFHGHWFRQGDSVLAKPVTSSNKLKLLDEYTKDRFTFVGNTSNCDCTFRIDDAMEQDTGVYYFRFEGGHVYSHVLQPTSITVRGLSRKPEFSIPEILAADVPVSFNCTSPVRCAGTAPVFIWVGALTRPNSTNSTKSPYDYGSFVFSSIFTFTPTMDDNRKILTCLVYYPKIKISTEKTVSLNVKKMPTTTTTTHSTKMTIITTTATIMPITTTATIMLITTTPNVTTTPTTSTMIITTNISSIVTTPTINRTIIPATSVFVDWPEFGDWLKSNCKEYRKRIICNCWIRSNPPPVVLWLINEEIVIGNYSNRTMKVFSGSYEYQVNSTLTFHSHRRNNKSTINIQCLNANKQGNLKKISKELGSEIITWIICGTVIIVSLTALAFFICGNKIKERELDIVDLETAGEEEASTSSSTTITLTSISSSSTVNETASQGVR